MSDLTVPTGWEKIRLPKIADLKNGGTPLKENGQFWDGRIPFVTAADLTGLYVNAGRSFLTEKGLGSGKTVVCKIGDLLIGTRTRVGNCSIAKQKMGASQDITRARFKVPVVPEYFCWFFRNIASFIAFYSQGTSIQGITRNVLNSIEIPVPSLNEQRRIVARIEELTRRAEEARQLRREALEEIDKSLAATVDAVFNERDEDWTVSTVKQLCGKPQYGHTASATNEQVGPRFLRITDIQNGHVDWESVPYCSCDKPEKYRLSNGDIVFARTGATTGKSYLVRKPSESVFASYLIRIRPIERVLPKYIWWYFQGSSYWAAVFSSIDDGNRPNMNGSKLGALKIPFPESKATQRLIVERLDALSQKVVELRRLQADVDNDIAFFLPALLAKAFRGEL